eukprot:1513586-Rhodomonas_salina.2
MFSSRNLQHHARVTRQSVAARYGALRTCVLLHRVQLRAQFPSLHRPGICTSECEVFTQVRCSEGSRAHSLARTCCFRKNTRQIDDNMLRVLSKYKFSVESHLDHHASNINSSQHALRREQW